MIDVGLLLDIAPPPNKNTKPLKANSMEKKLEDYLHFYIGCEVLLTSERESPEPNIKRLTGITDDFSGGKWYHLDDEKYHHEVNESDFKLLLRKLSDMDEDTARRGYWGSINKFKEFLQLHQWSDQKHMRWFPEDMAFLLKQGFDIFELIPANLALDAATLKK